MVNPSENDQLATVNIQTPAENNQLPVEDQLAAVDGETSAESPAESNQVASEMGATANGTRASKRRYFGFDPDRCRRGIAKMIIMHDYPLHMVEHPGFVAFVQDLQPQFDLVSFSTVQGDCEAIYLREKLSLQRVIKGVTGQICLTLDVWTSRKSIGYVFIRGQFIDRGWKLHRKLLNVVMVPYLNSDSGFGHAVASCLSDWSMEGRLFSITISRPLSEAGIDHLRDLVSIRNPQLKGQLLVENCFARTLSDVALKGLLQVQEAVEKVRNCVKYVMTSETQVRRPKSLELDDLTKWNTTYQMLVAASEHREIFTCLDSDLGYEGAPSKVTWEQVETLCSYLKLIFNTATILANPIAQTTNVFFHEAWRIQLELTRAVMSADPSVSSLTKPMKETFDKYWKECFQILSIAVVMDPRFKMEFVEFSFTKMYGDEVDAFVKLIEKGIHELFQEYVARPQPFSPTYMDEDMEVDGASGELYLTGFDMYILETTSQQSLSELDQYLEEPTLPRSHEIDVLAWWKLNKTKYPILSKMACDVLTIPVSTLGTDEVFVTVTNEMESHRCSLRPDVLEALICTKDWLNSQTVDTSNAPLEVEFPI